MRTLAEWLAPLTHTERAAARALLDHIGSSGSSETAKNEDWHLIKKATMARAVSASPSSLQFASRLLAAAGCLEFCSRGRHGTAVRLLMPAATIREALGDD